jgi:hypothetical protein
VIEVFIWLNSVTDCLDTAQVFYPYALGIHGKDGLIGLVNSAPYLCCALSCW